MERQSTRKLFKLVIALVALFTLALSVFAFGACGGEEHKHVYESSGKTAATCGTIGVETFTCSCGDTYVAVTPATGPHSWDTDGKYCTKCGLPNFGADGIDYSKIPDSFTAEDLDAIKAAITASKGELTKEQQAAHDALGQKIDGLDTHPVHTFEKEGAVKNLTMPGSCTTYGVKFTLSTCDVCGATFLTAIDKDGKLGHKEKTVTLDPTCQQLGYIQKICETCGELLFTQTLNTVAHEKGPKSETESIPATCTKPGTDKYECKWCHVVQSEWNETVEAPGHAGKPDPKDCTKDEVLSWHCDVCNTDVTENYRAGTHTFGEAVEVTTDCTDNKEGVTVTKTCSVCGFEEVTKKGAAGTHVAYTDEATTTIYVLLGVENANWKKFKAEHPEASDPANLNPPTTEGQDNGYNANNNVVKYTYYLCKTCGKPVQKEAVAECHNFELKTTGHEFNESGDPIAECVTYTLTYKCRDTKCDASYTVTVEGIDHDWSANDWDAKTGKGELSDGWQFVIDATTKKPKEATCTAKGEAYRYCKRCNPTADATKDKEHGYETHEVSEKDHVLDESKLTGSKAATCTEPGWKKGPCLNCEGTEVTVDIPALGHTYDDPWTPVFDETAQGLERCRVIAITNTCSVCGEVETKEDTEHLFMAYEHKLGHTQVKQEATCTQKGIYAVQCERCGIFGYDSWEEPALGHDMKEVRRDALSCNPTTHEYIYYKCSRCEETKQVELEKLDHVWSEEPYIYDCSTPSDRNGYYCTVCNADYGKKEITDVAKKFNQSLGFLPLEEGNKQFGKEPYKYGAHVLTFSNFQQGDLCGSDATFTITCENCRQFQWDGDTHDGTMVLTAEKFKGVTEAWGDVYDFLFKLGDFADRKGEAYRPAHVLDKEYDVKYTLVEYLSDAEKAIWDTLDNHANCNTLKTVIYVCSGCDDPTQSKVYYAEQHNWSKDPVWSQTLKEAPQVVQDALEGLAPSYELVKYEGGKYTLNTHDNTVVTIYWYCNDTSCITVPRLATLEVKWDGNHDWTTENTWDETWTLEQAQAKGWKLIPADEGKTPNCQESVTVERHCQLKGCNVVEKKEIKGAHAYGEEPTGSKVTKYAHLNEDGERIDTYTCSVCKETKEVKVKIPATGDHAWLTNPDGSIKWFKDWDGSCTVPSSWHKVCAYPGCGATVSVSGPATGHDWVRKKVDATCTTDGIEYDQCSVCGEVKIIEITKALGHLYYKDLTRDQVKALAEAAPDKLREKLNIVGKHESDCLAPESVTVECVKCGVRYAYNFTGDTSSATGHTWILITDTLNANVDCGDFLNSKVLAYCANCGLVIDVSKIEYKAVENGKTNEITFDHAAIYAGYIKNTEENKIPEALAALIDKNNNLNVNLEVEDPEKTTEEVPVYYEQSELIAAVVDAYKSDMIQLHKFEDDEDHRLYVLQGDCQSPTAYVVLCSRCGGTTAEPTIKADEDIKIEGDKTFYDYMQEYTRAYEGGVQAAYKKLGYTLIATAKNITVTVDDKEVKKSLKDLYKEYVTADELGLTLEEGEEIHAPGSYYTWYNFAAFTYSDEGHDWLTDNKECVMDPVLTLIFEDYIGSSSSCIILKGPANNNGAGIGSKGALAKSVNSETTTFGDVLKSLQPCLASSATDKALAQAQKDYKDYLNVLMKDYKDVVEYLIKLTSTEAAEIRNAIVVDGYRGVSNWCKRSVNEYTCLLPGGFKATIDHSSVYQIAKNPKDLKEGYYDKQFTYGLGEGSGATLPATWNATEVAKWQNDLLFVQYLKDHKSTIKSGLLYKFVDPEDSDNNYLDFLANDVVYNEAVTCAVKSECARCGEESIGGSHQQDIDSPEFGANCQRGPRCVICGKIVGQPGFHNLVDVTDPVFAAPTTDTEGGKYYDALQALLTKDAFKNLGLKINDKENTCWLKGGTDAYDKLKVCVGCLEAWYAAETDEEAGWFINGQEGEWKGVTVVLGTKAVNAPADCHPKGATSGSVVPTAAGVECSAGHIHFLDKTPEDKITEAMEEKSVYNYYVIKVAANPDAEPLKHTFTIAEDTDVAKGLIKQFPNIFEDVNAKTITNADAYAKVKAFVESYTYKIASTYKATPEVKVDEDGYLVLHYEEELTGGYCQAPSWDEDLCYACTLHFVNGTVVDTTKNSTAEGNFGIRKTQLEEDDARKDTNTTTGHYNDNAIETRHVYAPAATWKFDANKPDYVEVVCLRCDAYAAKPLGGTIAKFVEGMRQHIWFYFATADALNKYSDAAWAIADKNDFFKDTTHKEFIEKAKDYDGHYGYVADAAEAKAEIEEVVEKGGLIEVAAGVAVDLSSTSKDDALTVTEDTEIKLGKGATLTIDVTKGQTSLGGNATALIVEKGKSLKIEGGVVDVQIGPAVSGKPAASAIAACGVGSVLEFVNTVVKANGAIQAEDGGKIVVDNSTVIASGSMTVATNHNLASPNVTYEFTNSKILSYGGAGVGLLVNNENVSVTATGSLFYGTLTGAWIRSANEATFTNCIFVTGNAVTDNDAWGDGTACLQAAKAALLVGGAGAGYDDVKEMKLTNCNAVISYEWFSGRNAARQDTDITEENSLVKFNEETNEFTYKPYTGTKAVGGKKFAVGAYGTHVVNVTFDAASARNFGLTNEYLVKDTNVFLGGEADGSKITIKIGTQTVTINGLQG